jgi:hypothetical protein
MAFKLIDKFLDKHVFDIELECWRCRDTFFH